MTTLTPSDVQKYHQQFDLTSWSFGGEISRYAYLRTSEFFPSAWIHRAGPISVLDYEAVAGIDQVKASTSLGDLDLVGYMAVAPVDGWLVIQGGKIIYEQYPNMRTYDKHIWWSSSKTLAGTLVAMLEDEGQVSVDEPIETYLPKLTGTDWQGTPVIDILDMASGMSGLESDDPDAYTDPESPYGLYEASLGFMPRSARTMDSTYEYIASLERQKPSGHVFEYTSVNTFVCSWLAEKITGRSYPELISERIWRKLGAESDALMAISPYGAPGSHGMMNTTLRDKGRWGLLFTPSWAVVSQEKVISDAYIQRIQSGGRPKIWNAGTATQMLAQALPDQPHHNTYHWDCVWQ